MSSASRSRLRLPGRPEDQVHDLVPHPQQLSDRVRDDSARPEHAEGHDVGLLEQQHGGDDLLADLLLQWEESHDQGRDVAVEELCRHRPDLAEPLRERIGALQSVAWMKKLVEEGEYKKFYMHRLGHYLGMDVHDVGLYHSDGQPRPVEAGMVMTVEPGLYIAEDADGIPDKYRGIGVRIEDDVLVTSDGHRVLTDKAPKRVEEIEELTAR